MGKAKDGSECYTRQNKSGGNYVTCEGSQKKRAARSKLKAGGEPPVLAKSPPKPTGFIAGPSLPPRTSDSGGAGVVMPEGPPASFEGLFGAAAPVEPEEAEQGVNEDILAEVIPGLFEGMGSGVPIGERPVYKEDFLEVLSAMTDVGRETGKSTAADIDERVMISKEELPDTQEFTPIGLLWNGYHSYEEFELLRDMGWRDIRNHPNYVYTGFNRARRDSTVYYKLMRQSDRDELVAILEGRYSVKPDGAFAYQSYKQYEGSHRSAPAEFHDRKFFWYKDDNRYKQFGGLFEEGVRIPKFSKTVGIYFTGKMAELELTDGFSRYVEMYKDLTIYNKRQALMEKYKKLSVKELRAKLTKDEAKGLKKLDLVWAIVDKEAPQLY